MKSLSEPVDSVHQVKSKGKKSERPSDGKLNTESKKISCKFCEYEHPLEKKKCPAWGKTCKKCKQKNNLPRIVICNCTNWTLPLGLFRTNFTMFPQAIG